MIPDSHTFANGMTLAEAREVHAEVARIENRNVLTSRHHDRIAELRKQIKPPVLSGHASSLDWMYAGIDLVARFDAHQIGHEEFADGLVRLGLLTADPATISTESRPARVPASATDGVAV